MHVVRVEENKRFLFEALAPRELMQELCMKGHFCLGAVGEDEQETYAAGVLIFEIYQEAETSLSEARLCWLYVPQEFRRRGAGSALMKEFYRVLKKADVSGIRCDVPMPGEYDPLCAFLGQWGIEFTLADSFELTVSLGQLQEKHFFRSYERHPSVLPLGKVPVLEYKKLLKKILIRNRAGLPHDMTYEYGDYDRDISCVGMAGEKPESLFLVRRCPSGVLEPVLLRTAHEGTQKMLPWLMQDALHQAAVKYGADTPVHIVCRTPVATRIIGNFFPDAQPLLLRMGAYNF